MDDLCMAAPSSKAPARHVDLWNAAETRRFARVASAVCRAHPTASCRVFPTAGGSG